MAGALSWLPSFFVHKGLTYPDAEDASMSGLLVAWAKRDQCRGETPAAIAAWLRTVAWHEFLMARRRWAGISMVALDAQREGISSPPPAETLACPRAAQSYRTVEAGLALASLARRAGGGDILPRARGAKGKAAAFRARRSLRRVAR